MDALRATLHICCGACGGEGGAEGQNERDIDCTSKLGACMRVDAAQGGRPSAQN